jgi:non-ribosomal peptide synthase protein (TIGR01720 family)
VRRELQAMPDHGLAFGVLRYVKKDPALLAAPAPEVRLNHLGRMAGTGSGNAGALFRSRFHELPAQAASRLDRLVEVRTILHNGSLQAQWLYDAAIHDAATIKTVADNFLRNVRALAASVLAVS